MHGLFRPPKTSQDITLAWLDYSPTCKLLTSGNAINARVAVYLLAYYTQSGY